jgi:hypothetical protein
MGENSGEDRMKQIRVQVVAEVTGEIVLWVKDVQDDEEVQQLLDDLREVPISEWSIIHNEEVRVTDWEEVNDVGEGDE